MLLIVLHSQANNNKNIFLRIFGHDANIEIRAINPELSMDQQTGFLCYVYIPRNSLFIIQASTFYKSILVAVGLTLLLNAVRITCKDSRAIISTFKSPRTIITFIFHEKRPLYFIFYLDLYSDTKKECIEFQQFETRLLATR